MKIAFLDRDGTLIREPPEMRQVDRLEKLRILPGVREGLRSLQRAGYELVMVSNQDGLGTRSFPRRSFDIPQAALIGKLKNSGIRFREIYICPHFSSDRCGCRKPKTGLVHPLMKDTRINRAGCIMIGDRETDERFARRLGISFVGMRTNGRFPRFASLRRTTEETDISVLLNIDGSGRSDVSTGIGFLDHMLTLLAKNALIDLSLAAKGDLTVDEHHTAEDTAIVLGTALRRALGDTRGIGRYGFLLPMDEALAEVVLDLSGRSTFVFEGSFRRAYVGDLPTELIAHFFASFAQSLRCTLHMTIRRGINEHHKAEALFKGLGRCLRQALRIDPLENGIPSSKGSL
ncbi:MAG: imidazoleglycerol-phosphate dehydratase HisB [Candidatus Peribacteraceae bacterium]|nr:imidazoleglycerol-phosphate dehydratase HisB [Candidatus Peribacteraceae bacterium]MDD5074954.1 imidazoleglycerol-phosphate dehydratase HisB [Candidatus Peribacteraceae bacterium]